MSRTPLAFSEGPLGFPLTDQQAFALDHVLKSLPPEPAYAYRRLASEQLVATELQPGERADVSWISTEDPDRHREVVLAQGMNDSQFALNPIVTLQHAYWLPPVGKSLWRKRVKDGARTGIKAKTIYPPKPLHWPDDWPPDCAFSLVQADLLRGKSIGFLPTKVRLPNDQERERPAWQQVELVIEEWLLLEYACVFLPAQPHAVVEAVSKGLLPAHAVRALGLESPAAPIPFTTLREIERACQKSLARYDFDKTAQNSLQETLNRWRGRV